MSWLQSCGLSSAGAGAEEEDVEKLSCDGGKKSTGFCADFATFVTILCIFFNLVDIPSEVKSVLRGRGQSIGI